MNNRKHQIELCERFAKGELEVSVCKTCFSYYVHGVRPKPFCGGCFRHQPEEYKTKISNESAILRRMAVSLKTKMKKIQRKYDLMIDIRNEVTEVPNLLRPERSVKEKKLTYERKCLCCNAEFTSESKFIRLCDEHREFAVSQGMQEFTHYTAIGGFE